MLYIYKDKTLSILNQKSHEFTQTSSLKIHGSFQVFLWKVVFSAVVFWEAVFGEVVFSQVVSEEVAFLLFVAELVPVLLLLPACLVLELLFPEGLLRSSIVEKIIQKLEKSFSTFYL